MFSVVFFKRELVMNLLSPLAFGILLFTMNTPFALADKYDDALNSQLRQASDKSRDTLREPAKVLRAIDIEPGMTILDVMAGDGYYSALLASLVGEEGKVFIQNPSVLYTDYYPQLVRIVEGRVTANPLKNTQQFNSEIIQLALNDASLDMIFMHLVYHDLFWIYPDQAEIFDREMARVLKPGGRLVIIDHRAQDGTGTQHALTRDNSIHRIDENYVTAAMNKVGLKLIRSFEFLNNPDDDRTQMFNSETLQGKKTDRFFHIYQKPLP